MTKRWHRVFLTGCAAITLMMVLAACGTPEAEVTPTPPPGASPVAASPTPAPDATPPSQPEDQYGTLVVAVRDLTVPNFVPFLGAVSDLHGFREPLLWREPAPIPLLGDLRPDQSIAEAWEVEPDGSRITFTIREGVPFHNGWGDVTAHDVAWSFNNGNAEGNLSPRSGFVGGYTDRWEAVDDRTAIMYIAPPLSVRWDVELTNQWRQAVSIQSQNVYDELGEEQANVTFVGTGPFVIQRVTANEVLEADALPEHYRETAKVERLRLVEIPEAASLVAALSIGEVHISEVGAEFVGQLENAGLRRQPLGFGTVMYVSFGGNYWSETYRATGETIFPRPGLQPDRPWIGDPRDNESMESARLVREALSISIDREGLSQFVEAGLSPAAHTTVGFTQDDAQWSDDWFKPFDPDRARQLLADAGYPEGFSIPFWAGRAIDGYPQLATVIAANWSEIGLRPSVEITAYEVYRPNLINRDMPMPYIHNDKQGDHDDPRGLLMSPEPGGANRAIELPDDLLEAHFYAALVEPDPVKRIEHNAALEDFMSEWHLFAPLVNRSRHYMVRPEVLEWTPFTENFGNFNAPWTVVLSR